MITWLQYHLFTIVYRILVYPLLFSLSLSLSPPHARTLLRYTSSGCSDKAGAFNGVQGYMKLSISLLGPGDKPVPHEEEEELDEEAEATDLQSLVWMNEWYGRRNRYIEEYSYLTG